jgi:hypothetical protein
MKKLALVLFAGISFATAHAQVQFGLKGGVNFATQIGSDAGESRVMGNVNLGAFLHFAIAPGFGFQPELVYSGQGANYNVNGYSDNFHANYLNIPLLLKWHFHGGPYVETGPQVGFLLSAHEHVQGNSYDIKDQFTSSDFSWVFGAGYKIPMSPVGIDFRYNLGISNVENLDVTHQSGSIRNSVVQLGITYTLFNSSGRR